MCPKQEQKQKINGLEPVWKSQSKTNSLIIAVSVGGKDFEGESLSTLVEAINKLPNVINCIIAVGDTLQRHNYRLDGKTNAEIAFSMSEKAGDEWLKRNNEILKKLIIPYHIIRWNKWLKDEGYDNARLEISTLYDNDHAFQQAIQCSIDSFSDRFIKRHEELGFKENVIHEVLQSSCRAYLLEECAIIMKLWPVNKDNHCEYLLYPGKMTKALAYAYDKMVQKKDLFKWNKFTIKEKNLTARDSDQFNFEEKVPVSFYSEQERRLFLSASAACESIMASHYSPEEKVNMLSSYTNKVALKVAFFPRSPINDTFESTSQEGNFFRK